MGSIRVTADTNGSGRGGLRHRAGERPGWRSLEEHRPGWGEKPRREGPRAHVTAEIRERQGGWAAARGRCNEGTLNLEQ